MQHLRGRSFDPELAIQRRTKSCIAWEVSRSAGEKRELKNIGNCLQNGNSSGDQEDIGNINKILVLQRRCTLSEDFHLTSLYCDDAVDQEVTTASK